MGSSKEPAKERLHSGHNRQDYTDHLVERFSQCIDGDGMSGMFNDIFLSCRSFVVVTEI